MAGQVVLDSSAFMALIRGERGAPVVEDALFSSVISAVNVAEVQTKLVLAGMEPDLAWWHIAEAGYTSIDFDSEQARIAGDLVQKARALGLSLGDRACLALAISREAKVLTADRAWKNLELGIEIEVIR